MSEYKAKVKYDEFVENPLEWTDTRIVEQEPVHDYFKSTAPLYKYEHSAVKYSTSPFNNHWDSGQVGWIVSNTYERETLKDFVENEYTQWANGWVYYIQVFESETCECCGREELIEVDSLGGIFDDNFERAIKGYMSLDDVDIIEKPF